MTQAVDFKKLLSKPAAEIKRPPILPAGTYYGVIPSIEYGTSKQKGTPFVEYPCQLIRPGDDVDAEALAASGIDLSKKLIKGISNRGGVFYLTPESEFRVVEFVKSGGTVVSTQSLEELIQIPVGKEVMVTISQVPNQNTGELYNNLDKMVLTGN